MIENHGETFSIVCDFCPSGFLETGDHDFKDAVVSAQRAGWAVFKQKGEWHHKCPDCCGKPEGLSEFEEDDAAEIHVLPCVRREYHD